MGLQSQGFDYESNPFVKHQKTMNEIIPNVKNHNTQKVLNGWGVLKFDD